MHADIFFACLGIWTCAQTKSQMQSVRPVRWQLEKPVPGTAARAAERQLQNPTQDENPADFMRVDRRTSDQARVPVRVCALCPHYKSKTHDRALIGPTPGLGEL